MITSWPNAVYHLLQLYHPFGKTCITESQHITSGYHSRKFTLDEFPQFTIPKFIQQEGARLEVASN